MDTPTVLKAVLPSFFFLAPPFIIVERGGPCATHFLLIWQLYLWYWGHLGKTLPLPSPSPFSPHPQRALLRRGPLGVRGKGGGGGGGAVPWALHRTMHEEFLY